MMAAKWPKIVRSTASSRLLGGGFDHRTYEMPRLRPGTNNAVQNDNDSSQRPVAASTAFSSDAGRPPASPSASAASKPG
jgi:hypothetical protein